MTDAARTVFPSISEFTLRAAMSRLRRGQLTLASPDGAERVFTGSRPGPSARVELHRARGARRTVLNGSMGLAESYLAGDWDTPDLDAVLALGLANTAQKPEGTHSVLNPVYRALHALRDNTPQGSKRNIAAHYDLGNEFYGLWLDETMTYSSALFDAEPAGGAEALKNAQVRKWDHLLGMLQPTNKDHLLEIGCGWGGFALHAAREAGCRVTGVTLSEEQHAWATREVAEAGLEGQVDIRLQDYRHIGETFTGIASIEMFEAVGEKWWPVFFRRMHELVAPKGTIALQTITIEDHRFDDYRSKPDFVQRYIFPGGMLPSPERFGTAARAAGLTVSEPLFFGHSYAETLAVWQQRFEAALPAVRELGFDERFVRMWRYYLAYCKAGFSEGTIDVMQVRLDV